MDKKRIRQIIEKADLKDIPSTIYDIVIIICVCLGIVPLIVKEVPYWFYQVEYCIGCIYIVDFVLRIWTLSEDKDKSDNWLIIVDVFSIIASFNTLKIFKIIRIVQIFKIIRYSKGIQKVIKIIHRARKILFSIFFVAAIYEVFCGIILFNVEPESFKDIFEAIYYSVILTTSVGLGDITCTSVIGRLITIISGFFGIAIVSLPTAILTAEFVKDYNKENKRKKEKENV